MLITPSFLFSLESNLRILQQNTYNELIANLWWKDVAKVIPSDKLEERVIFSLESAQIYEGGVQGGFKTFDAKRYITTSMLNTYYQSAFELTEQELEDTDSAGISAASDWMAEVTKLALYWPQKKLAAAILANPNTYDGLSLFNAAHLTNGRDNSQGTFSNLLTGLPIDESVTIDVARKNLNTAVATIRSNYLTPTGYPRNLEVLGLLVPGMLGPRAVQLTGARVIPVAATGGAGGIDNEPILSYLGMGKPIIAPELGSAFGGSDVNYYLLMKLTGEAGPFIWSNRRPFSVNMHDKMTDAELDAADKLQWFGKGRGGFLPLHPFGLVKVTP